MSRGPHALPLTADSFEREVLASDQPVLVDFWATACGPCRAIAPLIEELAGEFAGRAKVGTVDVDAWPALAERYGVRTVPTLLLFHDGRVVDQAIGALPKHMLAARLSARLA